MNKRFKAVIGSLLACASCAAHALEVYHLAPGEKIAVDGHLDDPAWAHAPLMDRFW